MSDDDHDADDWLFDSIRLYQDLHMYELQHPTSTIEWTSADSLAVACQLDDGSSEILQLSLPLALSPDDGKQSMGKNSDFKVRCGGLHSKTITCLRQVPDSRTLVAAERGENCCSFWNLPSESDESGLIRNSCCLRHPKVSDADAIIDIFDNRIVFGSHVSNIAIADATTQQILKTLPDLTCNNKISMVRFVDEVSIILMELSSGSFHVSDTRTNRTITTQTMTPSAPSQSTAQYTGDIMKSSDIDQLRVLMLSSAGYVSLWDLRQLDKEVCSKKLQHISFDCRDLSYLTIKTDDRNWFSVSGGDDHVYIYSLESLANEAETVIEPVFVHRGHQVEPVRHSDKYEDICVWTHCWHSSVNNMLLSCANDGSLHAWHFKT